jgi:hypothetical protein
MKTKLIIAILLLSTALFAQDKPPVSIPAYTGSEVGMEVNLTKEDIQPTLEAMLPMLISNMGKVGESISTEDVISIFSNVNRMEYLQMETSKKDASDKAIVSFYSSKIPEGNWRMVFRQHTNDSSVYVFSQPKISGLYAFRVRSFKNDDGKDAKKIEVARIDGNLDFTKLLPITLKIMNSKK